MMNPIWKENHRDPRRRGPLRVLFMLTSMPVGGAETLLVNLVRRLDRTRLAAELCCLKELGPLGRQLAEEIPAWSQLLAAKYDLRVLPRLVWLMRRRQIDTVVTVGAGDKMFWGRLAARLARVPVVVSALHSTGWPDSIGRVNRLLTPLTDAFIGVAASHGRYLVETEGLPADKVYVIPNGVDTERFRPDEGLRQRVRAALGIAPAAPVCGIVAALRAEKNHELFVRAAARTAAAVPQARFLLVGDGPLRQRLETLAQQLGMSQQIHFLGTRSDVPDLLRAFDLFALTSDSEANPVSILEAMATALPVVATRVGSVGETVKDGVTGYLVPPGDVEAMAGRWTELLADRRQAVQMGRQGRRRVKANWSLDMMVRGYEQLITRIYQQKCLRSDRDVAAVRIADKPKAAGAGLPGPRP